MQEGFSKTENKKTVADLGVTEKEAQGILASIEITEANEEFVTKMGQIADEMAKRKKILKVDPDTGVVLKEGDSHLSELKREAMKGANKELTRESRYAKGAIIAGLATVALTYATNLAPSESGYWTNAVSGLVNLVKHLDEYKKDGISVLDIAKHMPLWAGSLLAAGATAVYALHNGVKSVVQAYKSEKVAPEKVQRIIAMMATEGMTEEQAKKTVGMESRAYFKGGEYNDSSGYQKVRKANEDPDTSRPERYGGYNAPENYLTTDAKDRSGNLIKRNRGTNGERYFGYDKATLTKVRDQLDAMGIKRISRRKYQP